MSAASVTRQTLREQVLRILRDEILNGTFLPGERLSEPELAKRLDVSLTPVREALGDLAASGLVVRSGRQGTHVRRLAKQDVVNLLAVRRSLGILAVRQAVPELTAADDATIRQLVVEQIAATELTTTDHDAATHALRRLNEEFHQLILVRTGNQWLIDIFASIQDLLLFVRTELAKRASVEHRRQSMDEHRRIAEALLERDAESAATAMGEHVDRLEYRIVALLTELERSRTGAMELHEVNAGATARSSRHDEKGR